MCTRPIPLIPRDAGAKSNEASWSWPDVHFPISGCAPGAFTRKSNLIVALAPRLHAEFFIDCDPAMGLAFECPVNSEYSVSIALPMESFQAAKEGWGVAWHVTLESLQGMNRLKSNCIGWRSYPTRINHMAANACRRARL